jgi:proteasome lid subunit RPN8/RPN11
VSRADAILLVAESAERELALCAGRADPVETGGILLGVYADGRPWIVSIVEIATSERGQRHFRIPGGTTHSAVRRARATDKRLGYLGDWHSHPADSPPSAVDLNTLRIVSFVHPRRPNPTMIVVRKTQSSYRLDARRIVGARLAACEIRPTGDLPFNCS